MFQKKKSYLHRPSRRVGYFHIVTKTYRLRDTIMCCERKLRVKNVSCKLHTNLAPVFHERGIGGNLGENIVKNVNRYLFM